MSKFVGNQYLSNLNDSQSMLNDYFVNDINFVYEIPMKKVFQQIVFTALANNILNRSYVSNAIDYGGGFVYYFPQAGANVLVGLTLKF
jgi:iron complex outermembrane receptor protein